MMEKIEFTDRYGGNPPSWLRGCFTCEAMGFMPVNSNKDSEWVKTYMSSHPECEPPDNLGYIFADCPDCNGTGRVNWFVTFARIPKWIWKGIYFVCDIGTNWKMKASWMSKKQHFILSFKIAFLADLGLWKP